jgi:hypothetical protein
MRTPGHPTQSKTRLLRIAIGLTSLVALGLAGAAGGGTARATAAPSNTSPPTISGTAQQNQTLTADKGTWAGTEPITYTYAWQRCNSGGGNCSNIKNATGTTYTLARGDVNHTLRVVVSAKNAEGTISATSAATALATAGTGVANTAPPTVSGTAQQGQTLTADKGTWTGTEPITYTYAWQRCNSSGAQCRNIGGTNRTTYTVQKADVDHTLRVQVTAKNAAGSKSATSVATALAKASAAPAVSETVSLTAPALSVVFGAGITLSGTVSTKVAGKNVTIFAQRYPDNKFSSLATVTTVGGGGWSYRAKPTIRTSYRASLEGAASSTVTIGVKPLVAFRAITGKRFSTRVVAARAFNGKLVKFQRRSGLGQWVTMKQLRLNARSAAIFRASLPKGTSRLRVAFSVNQAGAGYLGGISRTISYRRA